MLSPGFEYRPAGLVGFPYIPTVACSVVPVIRPLRSNPRPKEDERNRDLSPTTLLKAQE
jgi:hypothetical protein